MYICAITGLECQKIEHKCASCVKTGLESQKLTRLSHARVGGATAHGAGLTCGCHNSLLDISGKTRVVSQILRSTRKIWKNELIAIFSLTSAITKTDEISELKQAQEKKNSDLYSMQYTVLGKIHGKEVYLVPPQDLALRLEDRISLKLRKRLKQHNALEGVGRLANHTCCEIGRAHV